MKLNSTLVFLTILLNLFTFKSFAGDDPCTATALTVSEICTYLSDDNSTATNTAGVTAPSCGSYTGGDVWYSIQSPTNGYQVTLDIIAGTLLDADIAVYAGSDCSSLNLVSCDDNSGMGNMPNLVVDDGCGLNETPVNFWIRVWGNSGATGTFDICAQATAPPLPPTVVGCGSFEPAGNSCCDALLLTDGIDGYCGSTIGYGDEPDIPSFCAFIDNSSWVAFIADSSYVDLSINSFNCSGNTGIQVAIMQTNDCVNYNVVSNCWNTGTTGSGNIIASGLIPGDTYYIMFDGWSGDQCEYSIAVNSGVQTSSLSVSVSNDNICSGQSTQLFADAVGFGPFTYSWSNAGSLSDASVSNPIATPTVTTTYTVTVTGGGLSEMRSVTVNVSPSAPTTPNITGGNVVCENGSGMVYRATSNFAEGYSWSVTGGATIVGPSNLDSLVIDWGTTSGSVILTTSNVCGSSAPGSLNVTVIEPPNISVMNPAAICAPNTFNLANISFVNTGAGGAPTYYTTLTDAMDYSSAILPPVVSTGGTYYIRVDAGTECFDITSVNVTIQNPEVSIGAALSTCAPNDINLTSASISELNGWPASSRTFFSDSLDAANETNELASTIVDQSQNYWVRWETSAGCFDVAPIEVDIIDQPDLSVPYQPAVCTGSMVDLDTVTLIDANMTTVVLEEFYPSLSLANLGIGALANTIVGGPATYFVRQETVEGCFSIAEIDIIQVNVPEGAITGSAAVCPGANGTITFDLTGVGPFSVTYTDGTSPVTLNNIMDGHTESVTINSATTYTLTAVGNISSCPGTINGSPVAFTTNTPPTASIDGDATICSGSSTNLTFVLTGPGPFDVVYEDQAGTQFTLNNISDGHTESVSPTANTTYTLVSVTDDNSCSGTVSGDAIVTVADQLQVINVLETCNAARTGYTVTFDITGGDASNYLVSGGTGTLTGSSFESDLIPGGTSYNLSISDGGPCAAVVITGVNQCACGTNAGLMASTTLIEDCATQSITANHQTGTEVLETGDLLEYIVHDNSGSTIGTVYGISNSPSFGLEPGMMTNTTYYISAIAGPDNGSGNVDQTHTCLSVAQGTPIIFYALPNGTIGGANSICSGSSSDLVFNFTSGQAPFDVVINDGTNNITLDDINDGYLHSVSPTSTTTYTLVSITDNTNAACTRMGSGSAVITVTSPPSVQNLNTVCNATNTQYQVTFEITGGDASTYSTGGDFGTLDNATNVFTSGFINTGTAYFFTVDDVNACGPVEVQGIFACDCTTAVGDMDATTLEVCEGTNAMGVYDNTNESFDGNDVLGFVLHDGTSAPLGTVIMTSSTPSFAFADMSMTYGTTYYIAAVVGNDDGVGSPVLNPFSDPCLSISNSQPIVFYENPTVGMTGPTEICEGDFADLTFTITGGLPVTVEYTDGANVFVLNAIGDGHVERVNPTVSTVYTVTSVRLSSTAACVGTVDPVDNTVSLTVIDVPEVINIQATCNTAGTDFSVSFEIIGGDPANYLVQGDGGILNGGSFISNLIPSGSAYSFTISDGTSCNPTVLTAVEYCNCTPDIKPVISLANEVSCNDGNDGSLSVRNENGEAPFIFEWSNGMNGSQINDLTSGWYFVSMTDGNNCETVDSIYLDEPLPIAADFIITEPSCFGENDGGITFANVVGGVGNYEYSLNIQSSYVDSIFYKIEAGAYVATIVDGNGCEWKDTVSVEQPDEIVVDLGQDLTIQLGDSTEIEAISNILADSMSWMSTELLVCQDCYDQVVKPIANTSYRIEVYNDQGCMGTDDVLVNVIKDRPLYFPSAFSPNGDGQNDGFMIYGGIGVEEVKVMKVFTRWGEEVFMQSNFRAGDESLAWDGLLRGKNLEPGVYIWYAEIEFSDGTVETFTGDINLIR